MGQMTIHISLGSTINWVCYNKEWVKGQVPRVMESAKTALVFLLMYERERER